MKIEVSVPDQKLRLFDNKGSLVKEYPCSTSRFGYSSEPGSHHTPLGEFRVAERIGHDAAPGTMFRSRIPQGVWDGQPSEDDRILSRILWLDGKEAHNANTRERYIYIHGTNQEHLIGSKASHGCVRMTNADVIDLFDLVEEGTEVRIVA